MSYQIVKDTFVELPLVWSTLPKLLVIIVEAAPEKFSALLLLDMGFMRFSLTSVS